MFIHYKTQAFIFGKKDLGEADRIFLIFTQKYGSLEILAKGERKITSKLRGALEPFYLLEVEFIRGKVYKTLTDAYLLKSFKNIRGNLEKLEIAFRISEILKKFLKFEESDKRIWNLIITTFKELNNWTPTTRRSLGIENSLEIENWKLEIIYDYFLWNFLSILGYRPELENCVFCQNSYQQKFGGRDEFYFSSKEGGIICQNCFRKINLKEKKYISKINFEVLKISRILLIKKINILKKIKISQKEKRNLEILSEDFLSFFSNQ